MAMSVLVKKNIWTIFYLILLFCIVTAGLSIFTEYQNIYRQIEAKQRSISSITISSIQANIKKYETIIDILAQQLNNGTALPRKDLAEKYLTTVLNVETHIIDLAIIEPDGTFHTSMLRPEFSGSKSVMTMPAAEASFKRTLATNDLVVGRTIYIQNPARPIVPIGKTIRDESGNALFVISALIDANLLFNYITQQEADLPLFSSYVYRDQDRYYQFAPRATRNNAGTYDTQLTKQKAERFFQQVTHQHNQSLDSLKATGKPFASLIEYPYGKYLTTLYYLDDYDLFMVTDTNQSSITKQFLHSIVSWVITVCVFIIIIFVLFKSIDTSRKRSLAALEEQANQDYLTRAFNRFYLEGEFIAEFLKHPFSLAFIDIDRFKSVNDAYGHAVGDEVLIQLTQRLNSLIGPQDVLIRYSGDEFIIITPQTSEAELEVLCSRILATTASSFLVKNCKFMLSASVGIAQYPEDAESLNDIIKHADLAMHESKKKHNTFSFFNRLDKHCLLKTSRIEYEIKHALDRDELFMVYQPQIDQKGVVVGVEALIRWNNATLGFVSPDKFIAIAEANGYMEKIGNFVIQESLRAIHQIRQKTNTNIALSINVSVIQLQDRHFYANLAQLTQEYGSLESLNLILEVTENVFIDDVERMKQVLIELRESGVRIALDDFGTGYSSLSLLSSLPLDELKLDKTFIDPITNDPKASEMMASILTIAKSLQLETVAEGVEETAQQDLLNKLGCEIVQGYLHSKPLTEEDLLSYLLKGS